MNNVIEYPAGRVHKRYAAHIPRPPEPQRSESVPVPCDDHLIHPGVLMLGLITLWAMWCAGVR